MKKKLILEKKIRYDRSVEEHRCLPLILTDNKEAILYHKIKQSFVMTTGDFTLEILKGNYTVAFYWRDRPYNIYVFRNKKHQVTGMYINIVGRTKISPTEVSFEDLIIDIVIDSKGNFAILDEDELPESLEKFKNGSVKLVLENLLADLTQLTHQIINRSEVIIREHKLYIQNQQASRK